MRPCVTEIRAVEYGVVDQRIIVRHVKYEIPAPHVLGEEAVLCEQRKEILVDRVQGLERIVHCVNKTPFGHGALELVHCVTREGMLVRRVLLYA